MTGEQQRQIVLAAIEVAMYPPLERSQHTSTARVSWRRIEELRARLDDARVDWREAKADDEEQAA